MYAVWAVMVDEVEIFPFLRRCLWFLCGKLIFFLAWSYKRGRTGLTV